ncbi:class I SAM-dependent methyltransferase [Sandaracinus amylolyticus]|uniref:class I SAM-dependent methyltransferase n=1 Tax=Sandaracinus amylolyticus TaxID=927083 RepID=UPI001F35B99B|nr:class I SAM-dependent methyltransferase [Sandaracinus amylolyticus]UJR81720.1 Ubiquinone biosynthesis O-methyltransferase [Sandaracinus amylolyticus]
MRDEHRDTNQRNWDERARIHARSKLYDLDGFVAGAPSIWLHPCERVELGSVEGRSVCQLQCHLGVETLSWARLGASRVVGLDFSRDAIATARDLAERCGLADRARFVESDVHDAERALGDEAPFDVVYVSVGAICWLPSIARWARIVRALLKPGGVLYVREVHPMMNGVFERDGKLVLEGPYFEREEPTRWDDGTTYTEGRPQLENVTSFEWAHGLGEIVQALLDVGLVIEMLHEHRDAKYQPFESMTRGDDGLWRLPEAHRDWLPLTFTLRARLPG